MLEQMLPAHRQMLVEHLPYELGMLEWSYAALYDDQLSPFKCHMLIGNLAIESFWLHARNLLEFFSYPRSGTETGVASASDFVRSKRFEPQINLQTLIDEINVQIAHLQYGRPSNFEQKLNSARMSYVRGAINKAVKLFEADMIDEAKAVWRPLPRLQINMTTQTVTACTVISSTASVGSISVVGPSSVGSISEKSE
jgi:hypothetical protein